MQLSNTGNWIRYVPMTLDGLKAYHPCLDQLPSPNTELYPTIDVKSEMNVHLDTVVESSS